MKLLFDQNISFRIVRLLGNDFPGCSQVNKEGLKDAEDMDIWKYAKANHFTVVTRDIDFLTISMRLGHPPKIILLRIGNKSTEEIASLIIIKKELIIEFLQGTEMGGISCLELED